MAELKHINLTKKSYNIIKIGGCINLILGSLTLYIGFEIGNLISLGFASIGIISGALMITLSKGNFIVKETIKMPTR